MVRRQMTGVQIAEKVRITAPSFSRILNGLVRPRQGTLTKIIQALCLTPEEQQLVLGGYGALPDKVEEEAPAPIDAAGDIPSAELDRAARYLEMKAMSIDFKKSVARSLREAGIEFETDVISGPVVADFVVPAPRRAAIECKFNVNRDWERELATVQLLRRYLVCERVAIAVPYQNEQSARFAPAFKKWGAEIVVAPSLPTWLASLSPECP
jgi:transcriptional regulator with XRE-family HTH domain